MSFREWKASHSMEEDIWFIYLYLHMYISDKGFLSRICKEFLQIKLKEKKQQHWKLNREMEENFK